MDELKNIMLYGQMEEGEDDGMYVEDEVIPSIKAPIPHYELDEYKLKEMDQDALFSKVAKQTSKDQIQVQEVKEDDKGSILITGFGMRNLKSLQDLLAAEEKRLYELYLREQEMLARQAKRSPETTPPTSKKSDDKVSETMTDKGSVGDVRLQYLMGLEEQATEEFAPEEHVYGPREDFEYSTSVCMRKAQKYLRAHRIFDFFQFIIAQLLSSTPDNPIQFILELLNKCLLYRTGVAKPPTLYERKHFEQLFYLMDRMNTGYIDMEQYRQGMKTFGICAYNPTPAAESDGVSKETFIEEVEEAQLALFDDLIQRKVIERIPKPYEFKPVKYDIPRVKVKKSTFFMPDDLFKSYKKKKEEPKEEVEGAAAEG